MTRKKHRTVARRLIGAASAKARGVTTGEQQADRYDMSRQLRSIRWTKSGDKYTLRGTSLDATKGDEDRIPIASNIGADKLEGVVGKEIAKKIVDAAEKQATVLRVCAEMGISPREAIVMGDGANDLQMMAVAGLSLAFRAKPVVRKQATVAFNFMGLDGVLRLFG